LGLGTLRTHPLEEVVDRLEVDKAVAVLVEVRSDYDAELQASRSLLRMNRPDLLL